MRHNAHKLFYQPGDRPCFKAKLVITEPERQKLLECRRKIRAALRAGLKIAGAQLSRQEYYGDQFLAKASIYDARDRELHPRFRTQGSWAYDTLNRPCFPEQQIDLDEGMYLPMSIVEGAPSVASRAIYQIVERILGALCKAEGWTLDTSKSICVRLIVDAETHVDVNIYAVPDTKLMLVEKRAEEALNKSLHMAAMDSATVRLIRLNPQDIYVAHRNKGWERSDPLELEDWFVDACDRHAPWTDLRRIVRYLKAWRDHKLNDCCLSSLTLMVCAVEALDEANSPPVKGRDDDGLLVVARALAAKLASIVYNPVLKHLPLNDNWSTTEKGSFELAARALRDEMIAALEEEETCGGVVKRIRRALGSRVPDEPTLVIPLGVMDQIRATPARQVASPKVGSSTSGHG